MYSLADLGFQFTCPSRSTTGHDVPYICLFKFQFTCPSRSTTFLAMNGERLGIVSIHVPLAEHDPGKDQKSVDT